MQLFVGLSTHRGSLKQYPFDLLELSVSPSLPKPKTLREFKRARPEVRFSLRLSTDLVLRGPSGDELTKIKAARDALEATCVVIPSDPRFSPVKKNRELLSALSNDLQCEGCLPAWEPRGVWSLPETESWAEDLNLVLVRDLTQQPAPPGPNIYTRLLPFGTGARISQHAMETLASRLEGHDVAYVVVVGQGAKSTRNTLRDWFELGDE